MKKNDESKSCVKCHRLVKSTEKVVCGLWCRKSFHNDCVGLSNSETRVVSCSKERIKFHCETCQTRLSVILSGEKVTHQDNELENCVNNSLLELVQKLLKLTNELSNDNSVINTKLDTVISSNARVEGYILQSPKCFEKRSEETTVNSVENVESFCIPRTLEISEVNNNRNTGSKSQQSDVNSSLLHIASDVPNQLSDSQQPNVEEDCSSEEWEVSGHYNNMKDPLDTNEEEWEVSGHHNNMKDPLATNEEDLSRIEDFMVHSVFSIEKTEYEGCEERAERETDKDLQDEVESTSSGSKPESTIAIGMRDIRNVDDSSSCLPKVPRTAAKHHRIQSTSKQELSCEGKSGTRCNVCNKTFRNERILNQHTRLHFWDWPYSCSVCNKTFKTNNGLKQHWLLHSGERPYSCSVCSKKFAQKGNWQQHMLRHSGEQSFSCSVCSKTFSHRRKLQRHIRWLHIGKGPYSCSVCSRKFGQKGALQVHFRLHTGERPYSCSVCCKKFTQKGALQRHLLVHAGEHPYSKTFLHQRNQQYFRLLTGEHFLCSQQEIQT